MFSKKSQPENISQAQPKKDVVVHVMPNKFFKKTASSKQSSPVNLLVFIVIFLVIGSGGTYFFRDYIFPNGISFLSSAKVNINSSINENINKNLNTLSNVNTNNNDNVNLNNNINSLGDINLNENRNENRNRNINSNENTNESNNENANESVDIGSYIQIIPSAPDRDGDTLTDIEEGLYKTKTAIADTDKDGFWDGQEIANLYDPLKKSAGNLRASGLVKIYNNETYKYSVLYPASWKVVPLGGSDQEVTFVSDNKEFIEIAIMDNSEAMTATEWYLKQIPPELVSKTERIWANNFMGIKSLDGLNVYLTPISGDRNFIYSISYMVGSHTHVSFPVTFQMMVRSFDVY